MIHERRRSAIAISLLAAVVVAAIGAAAARAGGGATADEWVAKFQETLGRRDDMAYERQREAADALADLRTEAGTKALRSLIADERGRGRSLDRRRMVILLSALVRWGGPREIEAAVAVVEGARDAFLDTSLSRVLAAVRTAEGRAWLRGPGLDRTTPPVRAQVARALGALADREAVVPLLSALRSEDIGVRAEALFALGALGDPAALPYLVPMLGSEDARLREVAARALGALGDPRAVAGLCRALADPGSLVAESAAIALGVIGSAAAVDPLIERLAAEKGRDLRLSDAIASALGRITGANLGDDADLWRAWWKENRDRPRGGEARPDAPRTAAGPRYYGFPVRTTRVVFVIDVSRSMAWNERLETAKKELLEALGHLPAATRFDLVAYSDRAETWSGKLIPATPENVRRAARYVERMEPVNATNVHDALRAAFAIEEADTVFFLSDGQPTAGPLVDADEILAEIRQWNRWRRVRIHTIALLRGEPPAAFAGSEDPIEAASFMRRLAEENGGESRVVR